MMTRDYLHLRPKKTPNEIHQTPPPTKNQNPKNPKNLKEHEGI